MDPTSFLAADRSPSFCIEIARTWLRAVGEATHLPSDSRRPSQVDLPSSGTGPVFSYALFVSIPIALANHMWQTFVETLHSGPTVGPTKKKQKERQGLIGELERGRLGKGRLLRIPHWPGKTSLYCVTGQYSISVMGIDTDSHESLTAPASV